MTRFRAFSERLRGALVIVLEHPVWSWVMLIGCVLRATSYWFRPAILTPASARIEGVLTYPTWTVLLLACAALLGVGLARSEWVLALYVGHALGVLLSGTLASSILAAALADGAAWAGFWPLVTTALIHAGRANALGPAAREAIPFRRGAHVQQ